MNKPIAQKVVTLRIETMTGQSRPKVLRLFSMVFVHIWLLSPEIMDVFLDMNYEFERCGREN